MNIVMPLISMLSLSGRTFIVFRWLRWAMARGGRPTIGDHVKIYTGATVFGGIRIGNHVTIGAGTVVFQDVPDGATVVGNPARIIERGDGSKQKD